MWILFVGKTLLGFSEKEVGHMTFKKWHGLYKHFKNYHDFTVTRRTFHELDEQIEKEESNEWFDD